MEIVLVPATKARALAKIEKMSEKQEKELIGMLHSFQDGDGAVIIVDEGEKMNDLKNFIKNLAKTEGMNIAVRALEKRKQIVIWKRK